MRLQHGIAALIAAAFLIVCYVTFSPSGLPTFYSLKQKEMILKKQLVFLQKRLSEQKNKIQLLSAKSLESNMYLERVARLEYGFVGKDEVLLILYER